MKNTTEKSPSKSCTIAVQAIILLLIIILLYRDSFSMIVWKWFTQEGSYGLLIFCICLYMLFNKKHALLELNASPEPIFGGVLTIMGCVLYVSGIVSSTLLIVDLSIVVNLLGLIWLMLGTRYLSAMFVPVAYLVMMMSFFEEILNNFAIYLQYISAWIAKLFLSLAGIPVYLKKQFIEMPHITLEVAKACSGVHHIIALVALSVPLAVSTQQNWIRKSLVILGAFCVGIVSNGLRVAMIGVWTIHKDPNTPLHGPFEIFYASFIVFFGIGLIFLLSYFSRHRCNKKELNISAEKRKSLTVFQYAGIIESKFNTSSLWIAIAILAITLVYVYTLNIKKVSLLQSLRNFPYTIGEWHGKDIENLEWPITAINSDDKINRLYYNERMNLDINLAIAYFEKQNQEKEIIQYKLQKLYDNAREISIQLSSGTTNINFANMEKNQSNYYFWYMINGHVYTNRYVTKLAGLIDTIISRRSNGAVVIIAINNETKKMNVYQKEAVQFIQDIWPIIQNNLKTK